MRNAQRAKALRLTLPVLCGYLFLGFAFGATMTQAGFGPLWVLSASSLVYAGSLQFVMVPFLASGISLAAVALTALMINARHLFYGLSCIGRFNRMGRARPYMIFSLTDETYSVLCTLPGDESDGVLVRVALYDHLYWITGSVLGALMTQGLPFDLTGIDFAMTALFVVIAVERLMNPGDRFALAVGACCAVIMLLLLGPDAFLAPALAVTALVLTIADISSQKEAAR